MEPKINSFDNTGCSPLYIASQIGNPRLLEFYLQQGAKIQVAAKSYNIPLLAACESGNLKTVQLLLDVGAGCPAYFSL